MDLEAEDCYEKPKLTSGDPTLRKKYERLYHYTSVRVVYDFGDKKETLDGSTINTWLTVDEDGTVSLDSGCRCRICLQSGTEIRYVWKNEKF